MSHTAGPWAVSADGGGPVVYTAETADNPRSGHAVCLCGPVDFMVGWLPSREEGVANAHLIAAAPDLLALARFVTEHPKAAFGMGDREHYERTQMQELAFAAIAKAEGRS